MHTKRKTHTHTHTLEKTKQTSEPDMAGMLALSNWAFKTTMINMLRALMDKVDSI